MEVHIQNERFESQGVEVLSVNIVEQDAEFARRLQEEMDRVEIPDFNQNSSIFRFGMVNRLIS
jgi:uncharacterized protein YkuJ